MITVPFKTFEFDLFASFPFPEFLVSFGSLSVTKNTIEGFFGMDLLKVKSNAFIGYVRKLMFTVINETNFIIGQ